MMDIGRPEDEMPQVRRPTVGLPEPAGDDSEPEAPPGMPFPAAQQTLLPPGSTFLRILGVNYCHLRTDDDGDLYLTEHGLPFLDHLRPENWYEPEWFQSKRERLHGTSVVYRLPTRPLRNHRCRSIDLVVKWSRVGEDVPLDTFTLAAATNAEFNSPFEEFSLVEELRGGGLETQHPRVLTQKPLAIYVPPERMQLWQTGRSRERILRKFHCHAGVEIDILRSYILIYGWIKGVNAVEAHAHCFFDSGTRSDELANLTRGVAADLERKGFHVADHKPTHLIVRVKDHKMRRKHDGSLLYGLVDYELLARTPEHEENVKRALRSRYLLLQRDRFAPKHPVVFPPHTAPASVLGVDYVHGVAESTSGILWVVGRDPELFNYFLPERWRMKQIQLSSTARTWYARSKDRIHLVWKVSRVGDLPPGDPADPGYRRILLQGYNSPFEEFALALEMRRKGLRTVNPRAIYVTAQQCNTPGGVMDARRFHQFAGILSPDGQPALQLEPDYIVIYGYWRGIDDDQALDDRGYWTPVDPQRAAELGLISRDQVGQIVERQRQNLAAAGFEDVNLKADHILLLFIPGGSIRRDASGEFELRHCNLEMVRKISVL
jgi:hypothetical protein